MKRHELKTVNQTFSIPIEVSSDLHTYVKIRERSHFVSEAIRRQLAERKNQLRKAYLDANKDEGQKEAIEEWESTIGDGLEE